MDNTIEPKPPKKESNNSIYFSIDDQYEIAKILDLSCLQKNLIKKIDAIIQDYISDKDHFDNIIRTSEISKKIKKLRTCVSDLVETIHGMDPLSLDRISTTDYPKYIDLFMLKENNALLYELNRIQKAAVSVEKNMVKDKGGRSKTNIALRSLIIHLKSIYEESKEDKAGISWDPDTKSSRGPFYRFVFAILSIIDESAIYSNNALGAQIKTALEMSKLLPKPNFERIPTIPEFKS